MDILFLLIPLSVVLAFLIGWFFWRAVDTGQFDDLHTPAVRVVADDDAPSPVAGVESAPSRPATCVQAARAGPSPAMFFAIESIVTKKEIQS